MKYKNKSGTLISLKVDASNVNEDAQHRFVSDTEKNTYDGKVTALGGDLSNTKINNFDSVTTEFPIPEPGETTKTILGKMRKFLQDFNTFKTNIITLSKLANNLTTTSVGMALDARQGKVLKDEINTLNGSLQATNAKIDNRTSDLVSGTIIVTAGADVDVKSISKQNKIAHLFINGKAKYNLSDDGVSHFQASIPPIGYEYRPIYIRNGVSSRIQLILIDTNGNISLSGGNIATGETFTIAVDYSCN